MSQTICELMEKNLEVLRRYSSRVEGLRSKKRSPYVGGCKPRAYQLMNELRGLGNNASVVFLGSPFGSVTPRNGAYWNFHYCVIVEPSNLIYDPALTPPEPIPIESYACTYLEDVIAIWKLEDGHEPVLIHLKGAEHLKK